MPHPQPILPTRVVHSWRLQVEVPKWQPLLEMHPCDFQSSMLKGCTPSDADAAQFYSEDRRREIRAKFVDTASMTCTRRPPERVVNNKFALAHYVVV